MLGLNQGPNTLGEYSYLVLTDTWIPESLFWHKENVKEILEVENKLKYRLEAQLYFLQQQTFKHQTKQVAPKYLKTKSGKKEKILGPAFK